MFKNKLMSYNFREFTQFYGKKKLLSLKFYPFLLMRDLINQKAYEVDDMKYWRKTDIISGTEKKSNIDEILKHPWIIED